MSDHHFLGHVHFRPGWAPTLAALCALAFTLYLGQWQQGRAAEKRRLQEVFDKRVSEPPVILPGTLATDREFESLRYRQAIVRGIYDKQGQIFIDNKVGRAGAGYHVITPLQLEGTSQYLLVNRGYVPRGQAYPVPPVVEVAAGLQSVQGMLVVPSNRFLELSPENIEGAVWQNLSLTRYSERTRREVLPYILLAAEPPFGLSSVTERPDTRVEKHVEYMLTWYSLAVTVLALWIGLNVKLIPRSERPAA